MEIRILTCMAKVFAAQIPPRYHDQETFTGFQGESICLQVAYRIKGPHSCPLLFRAEGVPCGNIYRVRAVPVAKPVGDGWDEDYLSVLPGMYPDLLEKLPQSGSCLAMSEWQSMMLVFDNLSPGEYTLSMSFSNLQGELLIQKKVTLYCLLPKLPPQKLKYTRWFHCDALAEHYGVPVFSNEHWRIIRSFLQSAASQGMNMVLTPIHTPPLDTDIGAERATVQLVDIKLEDGCYKFGFDKLDRWIKLCDELHIRYFEMAHLYTQWGAQAAPKIVANVNGVPQRIFGWETKATGAAYASFLAQYLPALVKHLSDLGVSDRCAFHISDEPGEKDEAQYLAARMQAEPYLRGFTIMDALSHVKLYQKGIVRVPIPANTVMEDFLSEPIPERWTYYCCGQTVAVSNSFIAMPGERTRILGTQLYRHHVEGFLQWGLNYYYNERSRSLVNPFLTTDGEKTWPAGDPFNLYPGPDGRPLESLRSLLMRKAIEDMRALELLETLTSHEYVIGLIDDLAGYPVTFKEYPRNEHFLLALRKRVNQEIAERAGMLLR